MGGYFEFVNNSQPGNDYSNGQLHLRDVDRQHDRQQLLGHPDRPRHQRLHRVDQEHRPRRGLQHLRGLRAGQLQGQAARDARLRPAPVAPGSAGTRATTPAWRSSIRRKYDPNAALTRSDAACRGTDMTATFRCPGRRRAGAGLRAARRLRVGHAGQRQDGGPRRLRAVQLSTTRRPAPRRIDLPAGHISTTVSQNVLMSDIPNIIPGVARHLGRRDRPERQEEPAHAELELDRAAPAAVEHDGRELVRRQQERSAAERRPRRNRHRAVRRDAGEPGRGSEPVSAVSALQRHQPARSHALPELQLAGRTC